jgi:hypothetical protein
MFARSTRAARAAESAGNSFYEFSHGLNLKALGNSTAGDDRGWLFSAVGDTTVREIKTALKQPAPTA